MLSAFGFFIAAADNAQFAAAGIVLLIASVIEWITFKAIAEVITLFIDIAMDVRSIAKRN
jgi:hypothetical protein